MTVLNIKDNSNYLMYEEGKTFTVDWFSPNITKFCQLLQPFSLQDNIHFLEIGSWQGRSSCFFYENYIKNKRNATLTCIDTWKGSMENDSKSSENIWETFCHNTSSYDKSKLLIIREESKHALKKTLLNHYDFIYIDGSHLTKDVLQDAVLAFECVKKNGIITFDDYLWTYYSDPLLNPKTGIDAFLTCYKNQLEILEKANQVSIRKIIK